MDNRKISTVVAARWSLTQLSVCRFAHTFRVSILSVATLLLVFFFTFEQNSLAQPPEAKKQSLPPPLEMYMGREIAQTMHYAGAEWLLRNEREREERCSLLLDNLGLKTGMTVCDMGCGNGFYALPIAQLLGAHGRVLAVDIQPEMLDLLRERMEQTNVTNVTPILGSVHDPRLPDRSVDLMLLVDVYHEFSYPEQMLAAIKRSLKPNGVVALVEFRAEDDEVLIKPEHKMSKSQILREFPANGFELVSEFEHLPWQHVMFFRSAEARPDAKDDSVPKIPR
jgi:ubiquinone/menaquinone biosynthesis C-methylase UbiE